MNEVEVALAVSSRTWGDGLHRFLVDHGGARVTAQVLSVEDALTENYHILLIDDICSFLTPRLVFKVKQRGKKVIGVYDPEEFADGKHRLVEVGVDLTVESSAEPDEFLTSIAILAAELQAIPAQTRPDLMSGPSGQLLVVGGPVGGTGATEVALAVAQRLALKRRSTVLVDGDDVAPSLAQRLGLPLHPNLRSAIDAVHHQIDRFADSLQTSGPLSVLIGLAAPGEWSEVRAADVIEVVDELKNRFLRVVVNVGGQIEDVAVYGTEGRYGISRGILQKAHRIVGVGLPDPVGIARVAQWTQAVSEITGNQRITVAINRAPASRYRRNEIIAELGNVRSISSVWFLPHDPHVEHAAWTGRLVASGGFVRAVGPLADLAGAKS